MAERWLIVGADSLIGGALWAALDALGTSRRGDAAMRGLVRLDLAAPEGWAPPDGPGVAVIAAAQTSTLACEQDSDASRAVNVTGATTVAAVLARAGWFPVFLSTNQVFDGSRPFRHEDEPPCPRSAYGRQKAEAEAALAGTGAAILRLTKVLEDGHPLLTRWAGALRRGETVEAFADMVMAPVSLARAVEAVIALGTRRTGGIYHLSGAEDVSYAWAARRLAERLGGRVAAVSGRERGLPPALLPAHTSLDMARTRAALGLESEEPAALIDGWAVRFLERARA